MKITSKAERSITESGEASWATGVSAWTVALLRNEITAVHAAVAAAWLSAVVVAAETGVLGAVLAGTVLVTCGPHLVAAFRSRAPAGVSG